MWPNGLQHARLPCPSPPPRACSLSPLSQWCYPTILTSVVPLFSCLQSFPASGFFLMSQLFPSGGQYWSFRFNISPSNENSGSISFRISWLDLLAVKGTLNSLFPIPQFKSINSSALIFSYNAVIGNCVHMGLGFSNLKLTFLLHHSFLRH